MFPVCCPNCGNSRMFAAVRDLKNHMDSGACDRPCRRRRRRTTYTIPSFLTSPSKSLEDLQRNDLQPTNEHLTSFGSVLNRLNCTLNQDGHQIHNMIKAGSLGKGTAVPGKSDIDCVLFVNDLPQINCHGYSDALSRKIEKLRGSLSGKPGIQVMRTTNYSVKLKVDSPSGGCHDVDILPTVDVLSAAGKGHVYRCMAAEQNKREYYSVGLCQLQVDFIKHQPPNVKNLIRLVKYWKKEAGDIGGGDLPTSYPLELLTVHAWEKVRKPERFQLDKGFKAVLELISNYSNISAHWNENYQYRDYIEQADSDIRISFILDPANPYNNVCTQPSIPTSAGAWKLLKRHADRALNSPRLQSVSAGDWR